MTAYRQVGLLRSKPTAKSKPKLRVLGFDGAKVHTFLFHVALSEIQWQDLRSNSPMEAQGPVQHHKALNLASKLYDRFLQACSRGPNQATSFLATQHYLQKKYLQDSRAMLNSQQLKAAQNQAVLSEVAFGAQVVKSAATAGVAIIGLFLVGPEVMAGAGVALGFDLAMEMVKRLGHSNESNANTVLVGFKQTTFNEIVSVSGEVQHINFDAKKEILEKTLTYPLKSSSYRSAVTTGAQLNFLMKSLGWLSAGVTIYAEVGDIEASYSQMRKATDSYAVLQTGN